MDTHPLTVSVARREVQLVLHKEVIQTDTYLFHILAALQAPMYGSRKHTPPGHKNFECILNSAPSVGEPVVKDFLTSVQASSGERTY